MRKVVFLISFLLTVVFTGCVRDGAVPYEGKDYSTIKHILTGEVINVRKIYIKDDGTGTALGAVIGTVLGSTIGRGDGSTLGTVGGAVLGGMAGNKINEVDAQELTVKLEKGETVVVVSKGTQFQTGDKIRIVTTNNEVSSVYKID